MKTIEEQIFDAKNSAINTDEEFDMNDFRDWAMENSNEAYKFCLLIARKLQDDVTELRNNYVYK